MKATEANLLARGLDNCQRCGKLSVQRLGHLR